LKVAILTTEALHHAYFAREIARACDAIAICEKRYAVACPFETHHSFEDEREAYEADRWFDGRKSRISDFVATREVETMNESGALSALQNEKPDFVIVFGTGVLKPFLCEAFAGRIFNLHGGDPENYRGLDTHLWAIYHRDFAGLVTTLHRLDAGLDSGDIVAMGSLPLTKDMKLNGLRAVNSELCVRLTREALGRFAAGTLTARSQKHAGRYYSAMPAVLKDICVTRFGNYTAKLQ
jgi:folate-dependent phosphoribosylglycinamide formyltransferase PurN